MSSQLPPSPTPPTGSPPQIAGQPAAAHTNTLALVSLITGALSVFGHIVVPAIGGGILAVIAIVTGILARGEIKRTGEEGMWMSTVGIALGILHLALIFLLLIVVIALVFFLGGLALLHNR